MPIVSLTQQINMRKVFLLTTIFFGGYQLHAQNALDRTFSNADAVNQFASGYGSAAAKGAANGDTLAKGYFGSSDTISLYVPDAVSPYDSGFTAGMNALGYKGFAERFDIKAPDSTVLPLGAYIYFYGSSSASSAQTLRVVAWSQGAAGNVTGRPKLHYNGLPNTVLNSMPVNLKDLRKSSTNSRIDTFKKFAFPTIGSYVADSFFVGYDIPSYNFATAAAAGDSLAVLQTKNGERHTPAYTITGTDTTINVQNATQLTSGAWAENLNGAIIGNAGNRLANHYIIFARFRVKITTGVTSITRNGLSVFGTYPNPATNSATMKFELKSAADVTLKVIDMTGRVVYSSTAQKFGAGVHEMPINTSALAAGNYDCLIQTSNGDGMAIEMTVAK